MNKNKKRISLIKSPDGTSYLIPFILVTSLFLLWGFAHGLLDVLNKHFQNILHVSKVQSGFVQFSLYIGYLIMAIPAGLIMKRFGYKFGIILGLGLFALGAFLFYPAATFGTFIPFLIALFVIACGLACIGSAGIRNDISYCTVFYLLFHVNNVPDDICSGYSRFRSFNKKRIIIFSDGCCRRSLLSSDNGCHC